MGLARSALPSIEHKMNNASRRGYIAAERRLAVFRSGVNWLPPALSAVDYVDRDALALGQVGDARTLEHRSVHEDILAAPIWSDEAKSPHGVVPLDRAVLFDDGLVGRGIDRPLRPSASGHFLRRSAAVDTQDFGHLQALGTGTGADLERRARRKATVAAALDHTHMQEGITGPIGKLYEAETFVWIVPFDDGLDGGTGGRFKTPAPNSGADAKLRRGASKLSSAKARRRAGRKSLSWLLT